MPDRLPSLTALRAFEAAARHLSFAEAANELSVTPAALSFQIKSLETDLGQPLFVRKTRAIELTEAGLALAPFTTQGMEAFRRGWRMAQDVGSTNRLTVTAGPAFTSKWLAPRLAEFARLHPDIELRLSTSLAIQDLARGGIDMALRFGPDTPAGLRSDVLMDEFVIPVARPSVASALRDPSDLLQASLVYDESLSFLPRYPSWGDWLQAAGVDAAPPHGPVFNQADHALDMVLQSDSIVLGRFSMVVRSLREGSLVAPFALALNVPSTYRILTAEDQVDTDAIQSFRAWLLNQTKNCDDIRRQFNIRIWP